MHLTRRRSLPLNSPTALLLVLWWCILHCTLHCSASQDPLTLGVTALAPTGSKTPTINLKWREDLHFAKALVLLEKCTYTDHQVTCRELVRHLVPDPETSSWELGDGVGPVYDTQHRLTVRGQDACGHITSLTSYVKVPRPVDNKLYNKNAHPLYLVIGPVFASNLTVTWSELPGDSGVKSPGARSYKVTWRRVDGQVGHPGHQSSLLNPGHLVRGLTPGTRYEVCVSERLAEGYTQPACDVVNTLEAAPGPPTPGDGWCRTEATGTHWRCDVTWQPPVRSNGDIIGYALYWRDREGYSLHEDRPPGARCSPSCQSTAVLTFRPHEGCVAALTAAGEGWETCIRIHDAQSRLLAVFEVKLLMVVAVTLLLYILGPRLLGALLRCCIRGLARQIDDGKNHVV